jgi:succinylarginine dihydrolase
MSGAASEINFDGIVGPTHHYGGLGRGNLASAANRRRASNPKAAALEGLAKMRRVWEMGVGQAVLPCLPRPDVGALRRLGFGGSDANILETARKRAPELLSAVSSASSMWAANAATVSPSADTADGKVHFTPANLASQFHRSLETADTSRVLRRIFGDERYFVNHEAWPDHRLFVGDEGAANHTRLWLDPRRAGVEVFCWGRAGQTARCRRPGFLPRQTLAASVMVAVSHELRDGRVVYMKQSLRAIHAGAFHTDVVAVGHRDFFLCHERAFANGAAAIERLRAAFARTCGGELRTVVVSQRELPLDAAVRTYLFNSQIVTAVDGAMWMIVPSECKNSAAAWGVVQRLIGEGIVAGCVVQNVRQSMRNGGGPACLRLRVMLTDRERAAALPGVFYTAALHERLVAWVERNYRDRVVLDDLADVKLMEESYRAVDELTGILGLGSVFEFQGNAVSRSHRQTQAGEGANKRAK